MLQTLWPPCKWYLNLNDKNDTNVSKYKFICQKTSLSTKPRIRTGNTWWKLNWTKWPINEVEVQRTNGGLTWNQRNRRGKNLSFLTCLVHHRGIKGYLFKKNTKPFHFIPTKTLTNFQCTELEKPNSLLHRRIIHRGKSKTSGPELAIYLHLKDKGHTFEDNEIYILERRNMVWERHQRSHTCPSRKPFPQQRLGPQAQSVSMVPFNPSPGG